MEDAASRKRVLSTARSLGFLYFSVLCYTNFRNRRVVDHMETALSSFKAGDKNQNRLWKLSGLDIILDASFGDEQLTEKRKKLFDSRINRTIAFIHVGKSGGSSITRILRNSCHNYHKACQKQAAERYILNETSMSLLTKASSRSKNEKEKRNNIRLLFISGRVCYGVGR